MSLVERIKQLTEQEEQVRRLAYEAARIEKEEADRRDRVRYERYQELLPEAILGQRILLQALKDMGVIKLLNEVISPDTIEFPLTPAEELEEQRKHELRRDQLIEEYRREHPGATVMPVTRVIKEEREMSHERLEALRRQEWAARILSPRQLEDGTLDPVVRITLLNDQGFLKVRRAEEKQVNVSYSPDGLLNITGEKSHGFVATPRRFDFEKIKDELAIAFRYPQVIQPASGKYANGLPSPFVRYR